MKNSVHNYSRIDLSIALLLSIMTLLLVMFSLDNNCGWGDDYAAYISEGIAIAEGRLDEQTQLNAMMHLTALPEESVGKPLVYVWGYPLLHCVTYWLVGFDRVEYSDVMYYKIPTAVAFAIMMAALYLFLNGRFGRRTSLLVTVLFGINIEFFKAINSLYGDVLFMSLSVVTFWCAELYVNTRKGRKRKLIAVILGVLLWYVYCVRLNGTMVIAVVVLFLIIQFVVRRENISSDILLSIISFSLLFFIFNICMFPKPSALSSVAERFSWDGISRGLLNYFAELWYWAASIIDKISYVIFYLINKICSLICHDQISILVSSFLLRFAGICVYIFLGLSLLGMVVNGLKKDAHLSLFIVASFLGTAVLNLGQGLRYLYPILPFVLMFAVNGFQTVCAAIKKWISKATCMSNTKEHGASNRIAGVVCTVYVAAVCFVAIKPIVVDNVEKNLNQERIPWSAYSEDAIEIYRYIQNNIESDAIIAFRKPRALYLNTGIKSFSPYEENKNLVDAQYYLYYPEEDFLITEEMRADYKLIFENEEFSMYKRLASD